MEKWDQVNAVRDVKHIREQEKRYQQAMHGVCRLMEYSACAVKDCKKKKNAVPKKKDQQTFGESQTCRLLQSSTCVMVRRIFFKIRHFVCKH